MHYSCIIKAMQSLDKKARQRVVKNNDLMQDSITVKKPD